jgi:hypothetical protein
MKKSHKLIFSFLFFLLCVITHSQNFIGKYCYDFTDKDDVKTEIEINIKSDSTYLIKSIIYSSPKYGEIKKIENEENGQLIFENNKVYFKSNNSTNKSENPIKINNRKLIIFAIKNKRKLFSSENKYIVRKGLIFRKNKC